MKKQILSLVPAIGWRMMFATKDGQDWASTPLIGWALVEFEGGRRDIVGVFVYDDSTIGETGLTCDCDDLLGVFHEAAGPPLEGEMIERLFSYRELRAEDGSV